ncbi:hypothetical protein H1S01_19380 [Heliobacterium chlorum]|uniref:Uncharacterized protein n=1 Tax=Heliobacterium chlorum TaxID=2698 RepID=A0ABR7T953_HELCL|nr:hypothetical protein [Heliobacterium chlorum]MBC9786610.1 hypothetical protein [Heliobacterium chlorum]
MSIAKKISVAVVTTILIGTIGTAVYAATADTDILQVVRSVWNSILPGQTQFAAQAIADKEAESLNKLNQYIDSTKAEINQVLETYTKTKVNQATAMLDDQVKSVQTQMDSEKAAFIESQKQAIDKAVDQELDKQLQQLKVDIQKEKGNK